MTNIIIRSATTDDAQSLLEVHLDAVQNIGSQDYPPEILKQWSSPVTPERLQRYISNPENEHRWAAELNGQVLGFGALVLQSNELRTCYVSSLASRKGLGTALIQEMESYARSQGLIVV